MDDTIASAPAEETAEADSEVRIFFHKNENLGKVIVTETYFLIILCRKKSKYFYSLFCLKYLCSFQQPVKEKKKKKKKDKEKKEVSEDS